LCISAQVTVVSAANRHKNSRAMKDGSMIKKQKHKN
jgi:hypothetical protein